ncbi:DUF4232 domain-containing protein [Streptomyces sp. UNOB3_S3]|uniref:DUF4232 domain-containing protein n=1 Tax=Streptomyces sp. UNOB3_S3 TaxID=2871682 RepID=UPI001E2D1E56|nr:DUF4232 domain-containing protein [Streptomyces sp. UNOB3_S3]MCC3779015.1 DUF4232 domain-containing protein [Streptomyces sp. UNOB3_S3]
MTTVGRITTAALAATAVITIAACQGQSVASNQVSPAPSTSAAAKALASPDTTADSGAAARPGATHTPAKAPAKTPAATKSKGADRLVACTGANTKTTVNTISRPINHLALTVTNTGSTRCAVYGAPALLFDEAQAATQVVRESVPQSVVMLEPGHSAYAGIRLSSADGSGDHGRTARNLTVHFSDRSGEGSTGTPAHLTLPKGTYIDDSAAVTYWQSDFQDAIKW